MTNETRRRRPFHPGGFAAVILLLLAAGCGGSSRAGAGDADQSLRDRSGGAIVVQGQELRSGGGTLLGALSTRVTGMRVDRGTGRCPAVALRGTRTLMRGGASPLVYVDRSRFHDTCILDQLRVREIQRVEVYPNGSTSRPGYASHPHGLILVFLTRRAERNQP